MSNILKNKYGFDLEKVTWGYREKFAGLIQSLISEGFIGDTAPENTRLFFSFLSKHAGTSFDDIIHNYLTALNSEQKWLFRNPQLFRWWTVTGEKLAEYKLFAGLTFFRISSEGGLGGSPRELQNLLKHIDALNEERIPLALGLMHNYRNLSRVLTPVQLARFIREAEFVFSRSQKAGCDFIEGKLASSDRYIQELTCEARLEEIKPHLGRIITGVSGKTVEIQHLGFLDSDLLLERGSTVIALSDWLYLPVRISEFGSAEANRDFYRLVSLMCGAFYLFNGFPARHARPGYSCIGEYLSSSDSPFSRRQAGETLFELCEYARIFSRTRSLFPGTVSLLQWGGNIEFSMRPAEHDADLLLKAVLQNSTPPPGLEDQYREIRNIAAESASFEETAQMVRALLSAETGMFDDLPQLRRVSFLPDMGFPSTVSSDIPDGSIVKLNEDENPADGKTDSGDSASEESTRETGEGDEYDDPQEDAPGVRAGFVYDEWNGIQSEYYKDWCFLREKTPVRQKHAEVFSSDRESEQIRTIFQRLKPDSLKREKYLFEGDEINIDRLIDYVIHRKARIAGKENFYEKTFINERDLAISLLIDISGSTGGEVDKELKILDIEKKAAAILSDGLKLLGDSFGVFGFTGNGRENCEYFVFKDFDDEWNEKSREYLFSVYPGTSTRIGVALRHTGAKMKKVPAKRKLIFLVTDGKPMDSEYDPNTGYAYFDVRKACDENSEMGIRTFGIITDDEDRENLIKMLPHEQYLLIRDIRELPLMLSKLFLRLTA